MDVFSDRPSEGALGRAKDLAFAARLRSGEAAGYVQLVRDHGPTMYAAMRRCLRDAGHAEDALQDALVSVYRHAGQFTGASRLSTWLHRVAVNAALMQRRSRARRPWTLLDGATLEAAGAELRRMRYVAQPAEILARREDAARLVACIQRLPRFCQGVVELHDVEGRSLRETAVLLDIGMGAVKNRLAKGRYLLRECCGTAGAGAEPRAPRPRRAVAAWADAPGHRRRCSKAEGGRPCEDAGP